MLRGVVYCPAALSVVVHLRAGLWIDARRLQGLLQQLCSLGVLTLLHPESGGKLVRIHRVGMFLYQVEQSFQRLIDVALLGEVESEAVRVLGIVRAQLCRLA